MWGYRINSFSDLGGNFALSEDKVYIKARSSGKNYSPVFLWFGTDHIENDGSNNYIVACVFVAVVTFLPSSCLATIRGYTYRHTHWWWGFTKYTAEMDSGAMIYSYIASFIKIASGIQKLLWRDTHTEPARWSHKPTFIFFKNKEIRLRTLFWLMWFHALLMTSENLRRHGITNFES
jgi:hypothetical protein